MISNEKLLNKPLEGNGFSPHSDVYKMKIQKRCSSTIFTLTDNKTWEHMEAIALNALTTSIHCSIYMLNRYSDC